MKEKFGIAIKCLLKNEYNKYLILKKTEEEAKNDGSENLYDIPGGRMEYGEDIIDTLVREVFEETGAEIIPIKIVGKYYHTSKNFNYDGITFDSDRVEFFYFCKFKGFKEHNLGLKGEFDDGDVQISFLDYEDVIKARLLKRDKSMIERAINEFLLYKLDQIEEFDNNINSNESKKRR